MKNFSNLDTKRLSTWPRDQTSVASRVGTIARPPPRPSGWLWCCLKRHGAEPLLSLWSSGILQHNQMVKDGVARYAMTLNGFSSRDCLACYLLTTRLLQWMLSGGQRPPSAACPSLTASG